MSQKRSFKQRTKQNLSIKFFLLLTVFQLASFAARAAGEVDPSFNAAVQNSSASGEVRTSLIQPDGKILIAGTFRVVNNTGLSQIARLNLDGSLDTTFNPPDFYEALFSSAPNPTIYALGLQSDGKIIVGGDFQFVNSQVRQAIVRLNADGSLDESFSVGNFSLLSGNIVYSLEVQPDDKIVIGGVFTLRQANVPDRISLARLNPNGSTDTSFQPPLLNSSSVFAVALQPDGKIIVNRQNPNTITRLNSDGSADSLFNTVQLFGVARRIVVQSDGKILLGGSFQSVNGVSQRGFSRLTANGSLDTSFNPNGTGVAFGDIFDISLAPDGKIYLAGNFNAINGVSRNRVARLNPDGTLDAAFESLGINASGFDVTVQPDGRVIISSNSASKVVRINQNGALDSSFNVAVGQVGKVFKVVTQSDGKVLIAGNFDKVNGFNTVSFARLNADGSVDTSFAVNISEPSLTGTIAVQPDGKILVAGQFGAINGVNRPGLARLNANGTVDTSFAPNLPAPPDDIIVLPTGKILVSDVRNSSGRTSTDRSIYRLNEDGSIDSTFNRVDASTPGTPTIRDMELQPDGKIIIGGDFTSVNGVPRGRVARINPNGTLDQTFNPSSGANGGIYDVAVQTDGKILIAGIFSEVNGESNRFYLARLNADGSLDTSLGNTANAPVYAVAAQPDGKILIGGDFTQVVGVTRFRFARILANGSLDQSFVGIGTNQLVRSIFIQPDNKILIGGDFSRVNNVSRVGVARLLNSTAARRTQYDFDGDGRADFAVFRPANSTWYILNSSNNSFSAVQFGAPGDVIAPADYDGDGKTDIAVYRENVPGTGGKNFFYILQSSNGVFRPEQFGAVGDKPVPADFDGDGRADLAVYRDGTQTGGQSFFFYRPSSQPGVDFRAIAWGTAGDKQAAADYDGDGRQDAAVFRPSNANWYILRSSDNQVTNIQFGIGTDVPVPADYNGDGRAEVGVFRQSNGTWYTSTNPATNYGAIRWGAAGDTILAADFDGDGRADVAVFRPSNGSWYVSGSANGFLSVQWGTGGDKPIPTAYFP